MNETRQTCIGDGTKGGNQRSLVIDRKPGIVGIRTRHLEDLESGGTCFGQPRNLIRLCAGYPMTPVDDALTFRKASLFEKSLNSICRWLDVWHIDHRRDASGGCRTAGGREILLVFIPRFSGMSMGIDGAGKDGLSVDVNAESGTGDGAPGRH